MAPSRFGTASGQVLLAVDAGSTGSLVAMDAQGHTHALARLPDGPNPIVALTSGESPPAGAANPGLYVTDTTSHIVYFAPAARLRRIAGTVLVGSERRALFWVVRPRGEGFPIQRLATSLTRKKYNLEEATYIAG